MAALPAPASAAFKSLIAGMWLGVWQLYVADCVVTLNTTSGSSVGAAGVWKWVEGLQGSVLTGSGTSPQIPAAPGANGFPLSPPYYVCSFGDYSC